MSWVVEGVLIALTDNTANTDHLKILLDSNIPVVLLDKVIYTDLYSTVTIDDKNAAFIATKAILEKGKKNILGIFAHENLSITKQRIEGYNAALLSHNILPQDRHHLVINNLTELPTKLTEITSQNNHDGLFLMTDELLVNCINHFMKMKKTIPEDLSIVAISDGSSPYFIFPNISHIFHSGFEVGKLAAELLFEKLHDATRPVEHKVVTTNLVDLGSL